MGVAVHSPVVHDIASSVSCSRLATSSVFQHDQHAPAFTDIPQQRRTALGSLRRADGVAAPPAAARPGGGIVTRWAGPDGSAVPDWRTRPDGTVGAVCGPFQLLVHPPASDAYVRFVVLRCAEHDQHPGTLLQSGTRDRLDAAIHGAEAAARRLIAPLEPDAVARP